MYIYKKKVPTWSIAMLPWILGIRKQKMWKMWPTKTQSFIPAAGNTDEILTKYWRCHKLKNEEPELFSLIHTSLCLTNLYKHILRKLIKKKKNSSIDMIICVKRFFRQAAIVVIHSKSRGTLVSFGHQEKVVANLS